MFWALKVCNSPLPVAQQNPTTHPVAIEFPWQPAQRKLMGRGGQHRGRQRGEQHSEEGTLPSHPSLLLLLEPLKKGTSSVALHCTLFPLIPCYKTFVGHFTVSCTLASPHALTSTTRSCAARGQVIAHGV